MRRSSRSARRCKAWPEMLLMETPKAEEALSSWERRRLILHECTTTVPISRLVASRGKQPGEVPQPARLRGLPVRLRFPRPATLQTSHYLTAIFAAERRTSVASRASVWISPKEHLRPGGTRESHAPPTSISCPPHASMPNALMPFAHSHDAFLPFHECQITNAECRDQTQPPAHITSNPHWTWFVRSIHVQNADHTCIAKPLLRQCALVDRHGVTESLCSL
jgi:hypothetical protein